MPLGTWTATRFCSQATAGLYAATRQCSKSLTRPALRHGGSCSPICSWFSILADTLRSRLRHRHCDQSRMHWFSVCDPQLPFDDRQTRASAVAEIDHVSLLRQGTEAWNAWREANPVIRPDLRGANLSGKPSATPRSMVRTSATRISVAPISVEQTCTPPR